jgi:nitrogen regulatory protein PII-like uncharacterized protein
VTTVLRDKPAPEQLKQIFAAEDEILREKVEALLGQDNLSQFQTYTKNLLSGLSTDQFRSMITGDDREREQKSKQFNQAMREEIPAALAAAGLPADYQPIPMLNFRNIASEEDGDKSLKLLDDIYARVTARAVSFLSPEDLTKLQEFRTAAINNNRFTLMMNRTAMAPISQ